MIQLARDSRLKEIFRDIYLTITEFMQILITMDENFAKFSKKRILINNRKYSVLIYNLVEEYNSQIIQKNDEFIKKIAKIQKKFLRKEDCEFFIEDFCRDVESINQEIQKLRDEPLLCQRDGKNLLTGLVGNLSRIFIGDETCYGLEQNEEVQGHNPYLPDEVSGENVLVRVDEKEIKNLIGESLHIDFGKYNISNLEYDRGYEQIQENDFEVLEDIDGIYTPCTREEFNQKSNLLGKSEMSPKRNFLNFREMTKNLKIEKNDFNFQSDESCSIDGMVIRDNGIKLIDHLESEEVIEVRKKKKEDYMGLRKSSLKIYRKNCLVGLDHDLSEMIRNPIESSQKLEISSSCVVLKESLLRAKKKIIFIDNELPAQISRPDQNFSSIAFSNGKRNTGKGKSKYLNSKPGESFTEEKQFRTVFQPCSENLNQKKKRKPRKSRSQKIAMFGNAEEKENQRGLVNSPGDFKEEVEPNLGKLKSSPYNGSSMREDDTTLGSGNDLDTASKTSNFEYSKSSNFSSSLYRSSISKSRKPRKPPKSPTGPSLLFHRGKGLNISNPSYIKKQNQVKHNFKNLNLKESFSLPFKKGIRILTNYQYSH